MPDLRPRLPIIRYVADPLPAYGDLLPTPPRHPSRRVWWSPRWWWRSGGVWARLLQLGLYATLALAISVMIFRWWSLRGLSDPGAPFPLADFSAAGLDDDANAFVHYSRAVEQIEPRDLNNDPDLDQTWKTSHPYVRNWIQSHQFIMDVWYQGTLCNDSIATPPRSLRLNRSGDLCDRIDLLARLALLIGSRREEQGDARGAWTWYNAALRCSRHMGQYAGVRERLKGCALMEAASQRVADWLKTAKPPDSLVTDVARDWVRMEAMTFPCEDTIKIHYLTVMHELSQTQRTIEQLCAREHQGPLLRSLPIPHELVSYIQGARAFLHHEPERSRRVANRAYPHWIALCRSSASRAKSYGLTGADCLPPPNADDPEGDVATWFASAWFLPILLQTDAGTDLMQAVLAADQREAEVRRKMRFVLGLPTATQP